MSGLTIDVSAGGPSGLSSELEAILVQHSAVRGHPFVYDTLELRATDDGVFLGGLYGYSIQGRFSLEELAVVEHARGKGVGRALMARLEEVVRTSGIGCIYLGTWDFQAPGFYRELGYREFGRLPEVSGRPGKTWFSKEIG